MRKRGALLGLSVLLIVMFTGNVAAQVTDAGPGNPLDDFFQSVGEQISWYQGDDLPSFLIWIVLPAVGMYAIFRFIYGKAFAFAEENFRRSSGMGSKGTSDMADSMSKLLAAATSIMALIFWGGLLGWTMVFAGVAGLAWFVWANAAGLKTTSPLPFGGSGSGSDSDDKAPDGGVVEQETSDAKQWLDSAGEKVKGALQSGSASEAEEAEQEIEKGLQETKDVEMKLEQMLQAEDGDLQKAIQEAQDIIQREKKEQQEIQDLENRIQRMNSALQTINQVTGNVAEAIERGEWQQAVNSGQIPRSAVTDSGNIASTNFHGGAQSMFDLSEAGYDEYSGFGAVLEDLEAMTQEVQDLGSTGEGESREVGDQVQRVAREAERFAQSHKVIQEVRSLIEEAENEDQELEKIAQQLNNKEILEIAQKEEKQEEQLEQELQELMDKEETVREELQQAEQMLEQELEMDVQEVREMQQEIQQLEQVEAEFDNLRSYLGYFGPDGQQNVQGEIEQAEQWIEQIRGALAQLEEAKEQEQQQLENAENRVKQAISQVG